MPLAILVPVSDLKFAQPVRRNLLAPVLVAFLILGIAIALVVRYTPHSVADLTLLKTSIYPTHTVYKPETLVVGRDQVEDHLYVLTTVRIQDRLNLPLFLKDLTGTLVTSDGEKFTTSAVQKQDLDNIYTTFPALRPLSGPPLLRETLVEPGRTVEGMVLLHFPVTKEAWERRRSAVVQVELYHQGPLSITIPIKNEIANSSSEPSSDQQ